MPDLIAQGGGEESDGPTNHRWRRALPEIAAARDVLLGRQPQSSPASLKANSAAASSPASPATADRGHDQSDRDKAPAPEYADAGAGATAIDQRQKRHVAAIPWAVPWDSSISRHHALLSTLSGDRLRVTRDPRSRNPIFYRGKPRDQFVVVPGEHFVIGRTTFTLARRPGFSDPAGTPSPLDRAEPSIHRGQAAGEDISSGARQESRGGPDANATEHFAASYAGEVTEMAFAESALRQRSFHDTQARIELLARLPDLVAGSVSDEELFARVTDVLLRATPSASAVAIVRADIADLVSGEGVSPPKPTSMQILHYDVRDSMATSYDVSTKLVAATLRRRDSVLHFWDNPSASNPASPGNLASTRPSAIEFTAAENVDWAFCVPLRSDACRGWVLYVTGSRAGMTPNLSSANAAAGIADRLGDDVKFAEVVGSLVSGIRQANHFQQRHAAMRRFFAPVVLDAIAGTDSENWLQPRECDLSVMFCDLRGFSRTSEQQSGQLLVLLEQVSAALGVMTKHILDTEGVIGDFHGDAAMGFWGWPLPLPHGTDPMVAASIAAAQAAAAIRQDYARGKSGFRCGIGIASGRAVAGRIGTVDQVKVTAFGPVVNLASRLEGLTKIFGVEILVDETTATHLLSHQQDSGADDGSFRHGFRLRTLGRVRAAGTQTPVEIHQLIVPMEGQPELSTEQLEISRQAFTAFGEGRWEHAYQQLHELPAWDRPKDVLLQRILQHHRIAPNDWDGVLEFTKG